MKLQKLKGTQDILPAESAKWQYVEGSVKFSSAITMQRCARLFLSITRLSNACHDTTDIVTKEMYDFYDKGDHITLRPETLSVPMWKNKLFAPCKSQDKFYYMFRYSHKQVVYASSTGGVECLALAISYRCGSHRYDSSFLEKKLASRCQITS